MIKLDHHSQWHRHDTLISNPFEQASPYVQIAYHSFCLLIIASRKSLLKIPIPFLNTKPKA
jgi:hypothetical protein